MKKGGVLQQVAEQTETDTDTDQTKSNTENIFDFFKLNKQL